MVNKNDLDIIFRALSDPLRREIYQELSSSGKPLQIKNIICAKNVSKPLAAKHIRTLIAAGLLERYDAQGSHPVYSAYRGPLEEAHWWLAEVMHFWHDEKN